MRSGIEVVVTAVITAAMLTCVSFAQEANPRPVEPLTVCDVLRDVKTFNGKMVEVRGFFHFTHRYGGWIFDETEPRKARIWKSGIWLQSASDPNLEGGPVGFTEARPTYDDLIKLSDDLDKGKAQQHFLSVTLIGELRTPRDLVIVKAPSDRGDTMVTATASAERFRPCLSSRLTGM